MQRLLEIMQKLRAPDGCPWDREQTHRSLRPYLLEEAAEAVEAIESDDPAWMADDLGDVLLQVAFHAVLGAEAGIIMPLASATKQQFDKMVALGLGGLDKSGVAELTFKGRHA
jgi:uncharacterized protein YabN with tetrapyrrole methylase and pyrophosphatase domain